MKRAAIVLCGGHSSRMGRDKASLPFGQETMIARIIRIVSPVVDEVWVVARDGQELPELPDHCGVARDPAAGLGPLAGLVAGLEAVSSERAFLTSCDLPLLSAAYVDALFELSLHHPMVVPYLNGHYMVTSAIYSRDVLPTARSLLSQQRLRPLFLVQEMDARVIRDAELELVDPELLSFYDCNTPDAYREALRIAGLN
jgi:molybdopterin-guanine dinucleotide biosynthesis protein A